jgi:hypothetical protein
MSGARILVRYAKEAGEHFKLKVPLDTEYKFSRKWADVVAMQALASSTLPNILRLAALTGAFALASSRLARLQNDLLGRLSGTA